MCEVLTNFFKNLDDVENQADSLREQLIQAETEIAQVTQAIKKCEAECVNLEHRKGALVVELNHKELQLELLVQNEASVNEILSQRKQELLLQKINVTKLQDQIFAERTEFCDTVWEFSSYVAIEKKKYDEQNQKDGENVHEEIVQSEKKKSKIEAELEEINTQLNVTVEQLHDAKAEKEELEMYTSTKEYQELDEKLQSVVEEIKILEKVINTLSASADHNHKRKTQDNVVEVIESVKACPGEGVVSSRKKVSYYCYEQVEEQALHKNQLNSNNPIDFSDSPHGLPVNLNVPHKAELNRTLSSTPWKAMSNAHHAREDFSGPQHEEQGIRDESVGNRITQHASMRENGKQSTYLDYPYNGNFREGSHRETSLTYATWNTNRNPGNHELQENSFRQLPGTQFSSEKYYSQYQNMCFSERCSQEANSSKTENLPKHYGQCKNDVSQNMVYAPRKHFWAGHSMMHYPSVGNPDDPRKFLGHSMYVPYPQYDAPMPDHSRQAMAPSDMQNAPLGHTRDQGWPLQQEGGFPKETWPGPQRRYSGCVAPLSGYNALALDTTRDESGGCKSIPQVPNGGDWSRNEPASVARQPIYTPRSPRNFNQMQQDQQGSYTVQHNLQPFNQWHQSTDANSAGGSYHQTCRNDSNKENTGSVCAWRPKVRVAHTLQAFGNAGDSGKPGGVSSASEKKLEVLTLN